MCCECVLVCCECVCVGVLVCWCVVDVFCVYVGARIVLSLEWLLPLPHTGLL